MLAMNSRWKGIMTVAALLEFLRLNPRMKVFETPDKESRFYVGYAPEKFNTSVDGRCVRAAQRAGKVTVVHVPR